MNLQFGPFLVIAHRVLDNLIAKQNNWKNFDKGILFFVTVLDSRSHNNFYLPKEFQIGLAALWSCAGSILGFYN